MTEQKKLTVPEVVLPDSKFGAKEDQWLTSYIEEQLYLELCQGPQVIDPHDEGCKYRG